MNRCNFHIRANDGIKIYWDTLVLIIAVYNSFTIPMELSFVEYREIFDKYYYSEINTFSTVIFVLDIILQMNTTYYDSDGEEIFNKKKIIFNYMKGLLFIDILSSIPIDSGPWKIINILKLVRVLKLPGLINKMSIDEESKSALRMSYLVFELVIVLHLVGCFWNLIISSHDYWIPPLDFVWTGKYPFLYRFYGEDLNYRYLVHFYNAVLFLGGNEMGPRTNQEIIICTLILVAMAIFNASLFGDMAVLTEMNGRKQALFQEQIDIANTAMKQLDLPPKFQDQVREFLIFTQGTK